MQTIRQRDDCRAYLESYREAVSEVARMRDDHARLLEAATSITAHWSATPGGGHDSGGRDRLLASLADADSKTLERAAEALRRKEDIEHFIDALPTPNYRIILRLRYLRLLSWDRIGRELSRMGIDYADSHLFRLHGQALNQARELWAERNPHDNLNRTVTEGHKVET